MWPNIPFFSTGPREPGQRLQRHSHLNFDSPVPALNLSTYRRITLYHYFILHNHPFLVGNFSNQNHGDIKRPGCGDDVFKTQDASHDNCIRSRRANIVRASLSSFNFPNALHMTCCVWSRLVGQWAFPGGTAIPGRPSTESEQAPKLYPLTKISLISRRHMVFVSDIKLIRTDTTLWS